MKRIFYFILALVMLILVTACEERSTFTVILNPNAGSLKGAKVTVRNDSPFVPMNEKILIYTKVAKGSSVDFKNIVPGKYTITVKHKDYHYFIQHYVVINDSIAGHTVDVKRISTVEGVTFNDKDSFFSGWNFAEAVLSREDRLLYTISLSSNFGGDINGAIVSLKNNNGNKFFRYKQVAKDTLVVFQKVTPGYYTLTVKSENFMPFLYKNITVHNTVSADFPVTLPTKGVAGGYVFYDKGSFSDGWQFLEAAPVEYEFNSQWAESLWLYGTKKEVGTGKTNTQYIIDTYHKAKNSNTAAQRCAELNINGFSDWFLPSVNELDLIYQNLKEKGLGEFSDANYWSSTVTTDYGCMVYTYVVGMNFKRSPFNYPNHISNAVEREQKVRAIRSY